MHVHGNSSTCTHAICDVQDVDVGDEGAGRDSDEKQHSTEHGREAARRVRADDTHDRS